MSTLDHREKQYDEKHYAEFFPLRPDDVGVGGSIGISKVMFYVGTPGCANWVGDAPLQDIARQVGRDVHTLVGYLVRGGGGAGEEGCLFSIMHILVISVHDTTFHAIQQQQ